MTLPNIGNVFQLIFHYTTKHQKIIYFPGIHFPKENYFPANKQGLIIIRNLVGNIDTLYFFDEINKGILTQFFLFSEFNR